MINISICLTDLPQDKITTAKNGKKYINLVVDTKRETDQYGNTHSVYVSQSKEDRQAKVQKTYVGKGKEYVFKNDSPVTNKTENFYNPTPFDDGNSDLPF
jgi:hypothetical protein